MQPKRAIFLVDGENLLLRYQSMLARGCEPTPYVVHERDRFVWSPHISKTYALDIIRATYYTTFVGDDDALLGLKSRIQEQRCDCSTALRVLHAEIFKKPAKDHKTASVDIALTLDALHHCYGNHADVFCLVSGDGDLRPLVQRLMLAGKMVYLFALTDGLSPLLRTSADIFQQLDTVLFRKVVPSPSTGG